MMPPLAWTPEVTSFHSSGRGEKKEAQGLASCFTPEGNIYNRAEERTDRLLGPDSRDGRVATGCERQTQEEERGR
jgi:hypothetical protein